MIPALSFEEAYSIDKITIDSGYLSQKQLMDNAGRSLAQFIIENITDPFNQKFVILAGPGNNGGDGIICHHYLLEYGANSELVLINQKIEKSIIIQQYSIDKESIKKYSTTYSFSSEYWYIDGIFGIGLHRGIEGQYKSIIQKIRNFQNIISIDIPSGIYCDSGFSSGDFIQAEYTLSMGYPKWGHYFNSGLESTGELIIMDIGFKPLGKAEDHVKLIEFSDVCLVAPKNRENIHKYNNCSKCSSLSKVLA